MKAGILVLGIIFSVIISYGQEAELPEMHRYKIDIFYWTDSITQHQIEYWPNGNIKVMYENIGNGKKLRKDYFEEGKLKLEVEVRQSFVHDTAYYMDLTGDEIMDCDSGYRDTPDGKYTEYYWSSNLLVDNVLTTGEYKDGKMFGLWQMYYYAMQEKTTANFNLDGKLDGEYTVYYYSPPDGSTTVKWKGQYGQIRLEKVEYNVAGESEIKKHAVTERVGTWKRYDLNGHVVSTITYKYKKRRKGFLLNARQG